MGVFEPWVVALALASHGCRHAPDYGAECRHALALKTDAIAGCMSAYAVKASVTNAKQVVNACLVHGELACTELSALHPIDPIGAEIIHKRAGRLRDAGKVDGSIHLYERALALRGGDLEGQVRELAALSERYQYRGDVRRALAVQVRAFDAATRLGDPIVIAHVRVALAIQLSELGDDNGAERVLADSVDRLSADDSYLPPALMLVGNNHVAHKHPQLARAAFDRVLTLSDQTAVDDAHHNLIEVAVMLGDRAEVKRLVETDQPKEGCEYEMDAAHLALLEGRFDEALLAAQRAIATPDLPIEIRAQLESLEGEILVKQGRDLEAISVLTSAIEGFEAELDQLGIDELKAWAQRDRQRREPYEHLFSIYARAGRAVEAFTIAQRATARAYLDGLASRRQRSTADLATITRAAGERAEALELVARSLRASSPTRTPDPEALVRSLSGSIVWTYFVADGDVWLITFDRDVATVDKLGSLASIQDTFSAAASLDEHALARLDAWLAPAARWAHLDKSSVIHVVAGPPFDRIPFAALGHGDERWIDRAAFAYVPSAGVLAELGRPGAETDAVVVLGDPTDDLPGARAEATATADRFHTTARLGAAVRSTDVYDANHAALLAISSHADLTPGGASLRLGDRAVTAADIVDRGLAPGLVVLASCGSAAPNVDAWGALAGAFLAAGTPNVVASRWMLDDAQNRYLLATFYDNDGLHHPAVALAMAQRVAIARHVPVAVWASLVVLGTGENEQPRQNR